MSDAKLTTHMEEVTDLLGNYTNPSCTPQPCHFHGRWVVESVKFAEQRSFEGRTCVISSKCHPLQRNVNRSHTCI